MKKILLLLPILLFMCVNLSAQEILELEPSQSMSITGKGPGQDAALNPYMDGDSMAHVRNLGKNEFSIRIQKRGTVLRTIVIAAGETKKVKLLKGEELYFDADLRAKAEVSFSKAE